MSNGSYRMLRVVIQKASPHAIFSTWLSPHAVYFIQTGSSALSNTYSQHMHTTEPAMEPYKKMKEHAWMLLVNSLSSATLHKTLINLFIYPLIIRDVLILVLVSVSVPIPVVLKSIDIGYNLK